MDFNKLKNKLKMVLAKGVMFAAAGLGSVGIAGATAINMTEQFQPIIDLITVVTDNTPSWLKLVVLGAMISIVVLIVSFIKGIMSKTTGGHR